MRSLFLLPLLAAASESCIDGEANSLMQLKVPTAKSRVDHKHTMLLGIDISTSEGRSAILAKFKKMAESVKGKKIDDETASVLRDAVSTAEQVLETEALPAIQREHDASVNELQIAADAVHGCASHGTEGQDAVENLGDSTGEDRQTHLECRAVEARKMDIQRTTCDDWTQFTNDLPEPPCPLPDRSDREAVVAQLGRLETYANAHVGQAQTKMEACHTATDDLNAQTADCETKQTTFENNYCAHQAACTTLSACHDRELAGFNRIVETVQVAVEARKLDYRTVMQVDCFLGLIVSAVDSGAPVGDAELQQCGEEVNTDHLNIVPPIITPITPCDADMMARTPCDGDFTSTEYGALTQSSAVAAHCVPCNGIPEVRSAAPADRTQDRTQQLTQWTQNRVGFKCPHGGGSHPDRIDRLELGSQSTVAECGQRCLDNAECLHFSFSDPTNTNAQYGGVCMLCRTLENQEAHEEFTSYDLANPEQDF
jgi:hypothetical protein